MTALHDAASDEDLAAVQALLAEADTDVDAPDEDGNTALHLACEEGNVAIARCLLEAGARVDIINELDASVLYYAAMTDNIELLGLLIDNGADMAAKDSEDRSALFAAASEGNPVALEWLLDHGGDLSETDCDGLTLLHAAAVSGDVPTVELLVARGVDVRSLSKDGHTPLFAAALAGTRDVMEWLLDYGANVNEGDNDGLSPLHAAAMSGDVSTVELLMSRGANLPSLAKDGRSALHVAASHGSHALVEFFLRQGVDVKAEDKNGRSVLHHAVRKCDLRTIELLVDNGADIGTLTSERKSAMILAAQFGRNEIVDYLLSQELKVDEADDYGYTAVLRAAQSGSVETMERLIGIGADLHARTKTGRTALGVAAIEGHVDMMRFLINSGVDVNAADETDWAPLHIAAESGRVEVVELLLDSDANVHGSAKGESALRVAAANGHLAVVQLLLRRGSDAKAVSQKNGATSVHAAAFGGNVDMLRLLVDQGADVHIIDDDGETALHCAMKEGDPDAARYLMQQGVDVNVIDGRGRTALHHVFKTRDSDCVSVLLQAGAKATIDHADQDGYRAIHFTSKEHCTEETRQLLEAGANVHATTKTEDSPLDLAVFSPMSSFGLATIRVLCSHGAEWTNKSDSKLDALKAEVASRVIPAEDELSRQLKWCQGLRACILHWEQQRQDHADNLTEIPIEVIQRGDASVKTYIADMANSISAETVYRSKVCVVGPSEWGKSSLVRSIEAVKPFLMNVEDRTIGIDLVSSYLSETKPIDEEREENTSDVVPPIVDAKRHHVTFWDFAGQDVYQVAHSVFFSRRTLYVLVVDLQAYANQLEEVESSSLSPNQAEAKMNRFLSHYVFRWLHTIFARQTDASFLVIGTKADLLKSEDIDSDRVRRDLQNRVYMWKENYIRELNKEANGVVASTAQHVQKGYDTRSVRVRELKQKLDRLASSDWLAVSMARRDSVLAVRLAVRDAIVANNRGFPMGDTYSRVLEAIIKKREAAIRPGDGLHRIEYSIMSVTALCRQLLNEIEGLEIEECHVILRTLHDLGDIIWYEGHSLGKWKENIILDPMLVLDVVREVISHEYTKEKISGITTSGDEAIDTAACVDGFIAHAVLKTFPLWKNMDGDFLGDFKLLLQHFQLAYPAMDTIVLPESDLIVPTYWKVHTSTDSRRLPLAAFPQPPASSEHRYHCWEYEVSTDVSETIFDQFAVQSHSPSIKRDVRAQCFESESDEFRMRVALVPGDTLRDTLRIEVMADSAHDAWCNMRFYLMGLEKVLVEYPGLMVSRHVLHGGKAHRLQDVVKAYEDTIAMGKNLLNLRAQYPWMPPDLDWYITRAWGDLGKFRDLQLAQQVREKLEVVEKLVIAGDSRRRYPALWSLEYHSERHIAVLRMLSDLSGKCFHVPIEIQVPAAFLAKHGSNLKEGVSLIANVVESALSLPILQTAIEFVASRLNNKVQNAAKIHSPIGRLDLPAISDGIPQSSTNMALSPIAAMAVLKDLLALYNDSLDELSITDICNLDCAVTKEGHYVWAHASEIRTVAGLTPCQPEFEPPPTFPIKELAASSAPADLVKSGSNSGPSGRLTLCIETVTGVPERDWHKTYCTWQLLYGEAQTPLASGATTQNTDSTAQPSWSFASTRLECLVEMLVECRLVVQVKRRSRFGYTKFIGEGKVELGALVSNDTKQNFVCDPISVQLQAQGTSSATPVVGTPPRVVHCQITAGK